MKAKSRILRWSTTAALFLGLANIAFAIDTDSDGLDDAVETNTGTYVSPVDTGTNPNTADTDADGVPDGLEVKEGTDPVDLSDFNSFSSGLKAYYPFSGNAVDESGFNNHGTVHEAKLTTDRFDASDSAYDFDGQNDYIDVGNPVGNNPQHLTQSAWIRTTVTGQASGGWNWVVMTKRHAEDGSNWPTLSISGTDGSVYCTHDFKGGTGVAWDHLIDTQETDVRNGAWHHVVGVRSNLTYTTYVDGIKVVEARYPYDATTGSPHNMHIGHHGYVWDVFFKGQIDDVRIYDRALSEAEVQSLYFFETNDEDRDGIQDRFETKTGIYVSPTNTGTDPGNPDTDGDGLLDGAEVNTHGSSPLLADTDQDGFGDGFEVNTGFDPAVATSTPDALSSIRTAVEFRFNAANGVSYRIEDSVDLNEWNTVETGIIGQGGVVTRFYSTENQPKRYFRVRRN